MGQSMMPITKEEKDLNFGGPSQLINMTHNILPYISNHYTIISTPILGRGY